MWKSNTFSKKGHISPWLNKQTSPYRQSFPHGGIGDHQARWKNGKPESLKKRLFAGKIARGPLVLKRLNPARPQRLAPDFCSFNSPYPPQEVLVFRLTCTRTEHSIIGFLHCAIHAGFAKRSLHKIFANIVTI